MAFFGQHVRLRSHFSLFLIQRSGLLPGLAEESILDDLDRWILRPVFLPRPGIFPIFTPIKQVNMTTALLKNQFEYSIPEELFSIEPGQVAYFVPADGLIDMENLSTLNYFFRCLREAYKDSCLKVSLVSTHNELLTDTIAGRNPQETGTPFKVFVGASDSIAGIVSQYYGEDVEKVVARCSPSAFTRRTFTSTLPAIIEIDPENRPAKVQSQSVEQRIESSYQSGFDLGMKIAKPEKGSLAEKKLIAKEEKKLEKILRECAVLGIELDIDRIKKKVEDDLMKAIDYKLIIKAVRDAHIPMNILYSSLDIYVADGEEYKLDLTAIEKAVYLAFLLYKDGICIQDTYGECREIIQKIYGCLPYDERCEKETGGIRDKVGTTIDAHMNTMRGYFSTIRDAVAEKVADPLVAQDFAIEGFKNSPYGIARTTPEIRAQVKELFSL